jgi:hypothetical protein
LEDPDDSEDDLDLSKVQGYLGVDLKSDGSGGVRSESKGMGFASKQKIQARKNCGKGELGEKWQAVRGQRNTKLLVEVD